MDELNALLIITKILKDQADEHPRSDKYELGKYQAYFNIIKHIEEIIKMRPTKEGKEE